MSDACGEQRELSIRSREIPGLVDVVLEESADRRTGWRGGRRTGERVTVAGRRKHFEDEGQCPEWMGAETGLGVQKVTVA